MRASRRASDRPRSGAGDGRRHLAAATALFACLLAPAAADPARPGVMSLNVCTDQLVLAISDPGQIVSLSELAVDASLSAAHAQAENYRLNRGMAEEVLAARPEMIVTGVYSLHNTTQLLRGMGVRIEEFDYSPTLETIPRDIRRMGAALDRSERAEAIAARFEQDLARLSLPPSRDAPTVIAYEQNGVALGAHTLAHSVLLAAGFRNLAAERGVVGMAPFPLERLIVERPDLVLLSPPYSKSPTLADQFARHPALAALGEGRTMVFDGGGRWACGGPATLEALESLRELRDRIAAGAGQEAGG